MNSADLIRQLGDNTLCAFGETRMDQVMRSLRAADLIPVTGRGPSAAQLDPVHAARALIGANAPTAQGAAEFSKTWGKLVPSKVPTTRAFKNCKTFIEMLTKALSDPKGNLAVDAITVNLDWPSAVIKMGSGEAIEFGDPDKARRAGYIVTPTRRTAEFPASVLTQIALDILDREDGEWTSDV